MATMSMNTVIHAAFRRDLQRFLDALASFHDGDTHRAAQLGTAWDNFDAQLTTHHEGEHEIAWPSFRKIGVTQETLDQMDAEHERMATALATTRDAMATFRGTAAAADAAAARSALEHLQSVTVEHMDHEEAEIEETYLAHADSREMKEMGKQFGKVSPAKAGTFFAWLNDGAGPAERTGLDESVPKPVQKILGGLFGRRYRREIAPVWRC